MKFLTFIKKACAFVLIVLSVMYLSGLYDFLHSIHSYMSVLVGHDLSGISPYSPSIQILIGYFVLLLVLIMTTSFYKKYGVPIASTLVLGVAGYVISNYLISTPISQFYATIIYTVYLFGANILISGAYILFKE
jgi:hypothetical protein